MSDPKQKIDVFISSTSIDLPEHREAVQDAILEMDFVPNGMKHWPVSGEDPVDLCKRMVETSEIYIGIFAHRYGWRPDGEGGKSITEMEYDWAGEVTWNGKPIPRLCFVMKDDHPWPKDRMEVEAEADLNRFKKKVKEKTVGFFSTPDNLKAQVLAALSNIRASLNRQQSITWEPGAVFDSYTLRKLLGRGGNGEVWLADEQLPDGSTRQVAIKVLREGISEDPTRVERFKREISSMARIDHRHVVPVFTHGERSGQLYVVMPYLPGGTFRQRMTNTPLSLENVLSYLEQTGKALDHVHDTGKDIVHRDVKPENMLFTAYDELRLSDFGLVFSTGDPDDERLTNEGAPAGTGRYMAPEQWQDRPLSRRTDLYALGILAYELLTGHLPYQEPTDYLLAKAHCERQLPDDPQLTPEMLRILRKMTAHTPDERYSTARAFLSDLRNWDVDPANLEPRIRDYLRWVTDDLYESVRAQFVELKGDETALTPRPARPPIPAWDDDDDLFARASAEMQADHVSPETDRKQFVENVRQRLMTLDKAVLIGEPGSGKSWMLQRLQADYARAWLKGDHDGRGLVPVLVRLNNYEGGSFTDFVKEALDTLAPYHNRLLSDGRLVLLCDALNEMPRRDQQTQKLIDYLKKVPYFVVSCRVRDYENDLDPLKPLEQVLLRDLELPAIRELVHKRLPDAMGETLWQEMGGNDELMTFWRQVNEEDEGDKFWDAGADFPVRIKYESPWRAWQQIHTGARLIPLSRNPYMGDLLCRTYRESAGQLPDSRAQLFGQFVTKMLGREARAASRRGDIFPQAGDITAALVELARALQNAGRTVLSRQDAMRAVTVLSTADPSTDRAEIQPASLLRAATDANILSAEGENLKFAHQLLQEYFAARVMLEKMEADEAEKTHHRAVELFEPDWWQAGVWRETVVILGEFLGEGARGANRVARWLAPVTPEVALQVITRNGAGLSLEDVESDTRQALIAGAEGRTGEQNPAGRAAAYRISGLFDADGRPGVGLRDDGLPDIAWGKPVPAGTYTVGGDPEAYNFMDKGVPEKQVTFEYSYRLTRYPVTYKQFQAFVKSGDYLADAWWHGLAAEEGHRQVREQRYPYANHPREIVNWYQAVAFTRWLTARYRAAGLLADDHEIRLPTEQEWEAAARYPNGRKFPYGDEADTAKMNVDETGIGQTSAVGLFPAGKNPALELYDLSGNVYEWCLNEYDNPDKTDVSGTSRRVLRGGSFLLGVGNARAASRDLFNPDDILWHLGFRVVSAPVTAL